MGNQNSRVAPIKTLHILDTQTRTRYKNQRETNRLHVKLRNIRVEHHDTLARLAFDEQDVKMKLHELQYEKIQRDLYKSIDKQRPKSKPSLSNASHHDNQARVDTPILLLHNLHEAQERDRSNIFPNIRSNTPNKNKTLSTFETFQLQYSSKADIERHRLEQTEKTLLTHTRSLQKETEQMKKSIKTAVAKAVRDSNMVSRRDNHTY